MARGGGLRERFVADAHSLDVTGDDPLNQHGSGGGPMSLREVLVGMIWEYGRHGGHANLPRERIDETYRSVTHPRIWRLSMSQDQLPAPQTVSSSPTS